MGVMAQYGRHLAFLYAVAHLLKHQRIAHSIENCKKSLTTVLVLNLLKSRGYVITDDIVINT